MKLFSIILIFLTVLGCSDATNRDIDGIAPQNNSEVLSQDSIANKLPTLIFTWEVNFTSAEKDTLKEWIHEVNAAVCATLGVLPYDIHVNLMESNSGSRPVPFGFARRRDGKSQVHLYVNKGFTKADFLADWTAQHEFSHLYIPFLSKKSKWFTEGFATYLSRRVMIKQGYFTESSFNEMYRSKFAEAKPYYNSSTTNFVEVSDSLKNNHIYWAMYWGGASYFYVIDEKLQQEKNMRFEEVIQQYQLCCHNGSDKSLKDVIASFDEVIGETWFNDLMKLYRNEPAREVLRNF